MESGMESGTEIFADESTRATMDHPPGWVVHLSWAGPGSRAYWYESKREAFGRLHEVANGHGAEVVGNHVDLTPPGAQFPSYGWVSYSAGKPAADVPADVK